MSSLLQSQSTLSNSYTYYMTLSPNFKKKPKYNSFLTSDSTTSQSSHDLKQKFLRHKSVFSRNDSFTDNNTLTVNNRIISPFVKKERTKRIQKEINSLNNFIKNKKIHKPLFFNSFINNMIRPTQRDNIDDIILIEDEKNKNKYYKKFNYTGHYYDNNENKDNFNIISEKKNNYGIDDYKSFNYKIKNKPKIKHLRKYESFNDYHLDFYDYDVFMKTMINCKNKWVNKWRNDFKYLNKKY